MKTKTLSTGSTRSLFAACVLPAALLYVLLTAMPVPAADAKAPAAYCPMPPTEAELEAARERRKLWENNTLGKEAWVPPPWTPVVVTGQTVHVWGRQYIFKDSLFPVQIVNQGSEILNRGLFLDLRTEAGALPVSAGSVKRMSLTDEKAVFEGTTTALGVKVTVTSEIEFDGMVKVSLRLAPAAKPVTVNRLAFRMPVREAVARYYHWGARSWDPSVSNGGEIPGDGLMGGFRHTVWLGDREQGLGWFAEPGSDSDWKNARPFEAIRIFRHERERDWNMRINLIDQAFMLDKPVEFVFGFQATPVKPMPVRYRHMKFPVLWHWARGYLDQIPGESVSLRPGHQAPLAEVLKANPEYLPIQAAGMGAECDYQGRVLPEQWLYAQEWRGKPQARIDFPRNNWAGHVYYHNGGGGLDTSFQDFQVYYINELVNRYNLDGIYFDGCGAGFHAREFLKRVYKILRRRHPEQTRVFIHSSTSRSSYLLAFSDFQYDGENFNAGRLRVGAHYTEVLPIDRIVAEYTGRQWGWVPVFLPELDAENRKLVAPTREMIALLQLHDVMLSGAWCHSPTFAAFRAALDRFGVADADFTGYWEQPVAHAHPSIKISRYRHRNLKQGLLFISNLTPDIQEMALDLGAAGLGFTPTRAEDIEHAYPLALQDGHVLVAVNGMDYRMIALYP